MFAKLRSFKFLVFNLGHFDRNLYAQMTQIVAFHQDMIEKKILKEQKYNSHINVI